MLCIGVWVDYENSKNTKNAQLVNTCHDCLCIEHTHTHRWRCPIKFSVGPAPRESGTHTRQ